jgi:adenosylcobinamide kinase/adenosylcobinamide-phosphate guanylyltransferase
MILGGARSGKSRYAEGLIASMPSPWVYVATAEPLDDEMRERIGHHRERRKANWRTIEVPLALPECIEQLANGDHPILIDCLTLWLSNSLLAEIDLERAGDRLITALEKVSSPVVVVSNEVGLSIVPNTPLGRRFRDAQGRLNQRVAFLADRVVLMVAGLPMTVK